MATRRAAILAGLSAPLLARARAPRRFAAAWDGPDGRHHAGVLDADESVMRVVASVDLPTRAHGLTWLPGGELLVVARRPGDWLMRWRPGAATARFAWAEPGRAFNGHAIAAAGGRAVFATETDLDSGAGFVAVLDARGFQRLHTWPTHGIDPHALMHADGPSLLVANGGVPTRPETGRTKHDLDRMDSSLVRLDAATGRLLGQWRLADARLSLRHLARQGDRIGIALQAEHDDAAARSAAPVLAVFDGATIAVPSAPSLAGYGGDIAAGADGFVVSCPRDDALLWWRPGAAPRVTALPDACALASVEGRVWAAGRERVQAGPDGASFAAPVRVDNHWVCTITTR